MSEFIAKPAALLLSHEAAKQALSAILATEIDVFSDQIWVYMQDSNPLLFDLLEVYLKEIESSGLENDQVDSITNAYRIGSTTTFFALSQNVDPDLPQVGKMASLHAKAMLDKFGHTPVSIGSYLMDPNLNKVVNVVKEFNSDKLGLDELSDTSIDVGAGFTRFFLDNQLKWTGLSEFN